MAKALFVLLFLVGCGIVAVLFLRFWDAKADKNLFDDLERRATADLLRFDDAMLANLPEPAARFFRFAIQPGTELKTVAVIQMRGELSLGTKEQPKYQPMKARQILAPPFGFLWQVQLESAAKVTGSDAYGPSGSWSRFRVFNAIPVGRVSGNADHLRSAFGRMVGEGLFWSPAAFLPAAKAGWDHIEWKMVDADTATVIVRHNGLEQQATMSVDESGKPLRVVFQRWSNENPDRVYQAQPFGGDLADFKKFGGFTLPTSVIGGNHYGTPLYHPFYKAQIGEVRFP